MEVKYFKDKLLEKFKSRNYTIDKGSNTEVLCDIMAQFTSEIYNLKLQAMELKNFKTSEDLEFMSKECLDLFNLYSERHYPFNFIVSKNEIIKEYKEPENSKFNLSETLERLKVGSNIGDFVVVQSGPNYDDTLYYLAYVDKVTHLINSDSESFKFKNDYNDLTAFSLLEDLDTSEVYQESTNINFIYEPKDYTILPDEIILDSKLLNKNLRLTLYKYKDIKISKEDLEKIAYYDTQHDTFSMLNVNDFIRTSAESLADLGIFTFEFNLGKKVTPTYLREVCDYKVKYKFF